MNVTESVATPAEWWRPVIAALPMFASAMHLAEVFGVSASTVYRMWNQGELGWVSVGGQKRSSREHVADYLRNQRHEAAATTRNEAA